MGFQHQSFVFQLHFGDYFVRTAVLRIQDSLLSGGWLQGQQIRECKWLPGMRTGAVRSDMALDCGSLVNMACLEADDRIVQDASGKGANYS